MRIFFALVGGFVVLAVVMALSALFGARRDT